MNSKKDLEDLQKEIEEIRTERFNYGLELGLPVIPFPPVYKDDGFYDTGSEFLKYNREFYKDLPGIYKVINAKFNNNNGDLNYLDDFEKAVYVTMMSYKLGFEPTEYPFKLFENPQHKLGLYLTKNSADRLRMMYNLSITEPMLQVMNNMMVVVTKIKDRYGREDIDSSSFDLRTANLTSVERESNIKRIITQAKRRTTTTFLGIVFYEEEELDSVKSTISQLNETKNNEVIPTTDEKKVIEDSRVNDFISSMDGDVPSSDQIDLIYDEPIVNVDMTMEEKIQTLVNVVKEKGYPSAVDVIKSQFKNTEKPLIINGLNERLTELKIQFVNN